MSTPQVSVVVPAYNNARTLKETLDSVLAQEGVEFELVIADHSSEDDSASVLAPYASDPRVVLLSETPSGGGAPRNWRRVTERARGEYIKLVCGDDVLRPGVLARQAELLSRSDRVVLTACKRDVVDAGGLVLKRGWGLRGLGEAMSGSRAIRRAVRAGSNLFGEPASVMMRRTTLHEVGGWDPTFPYLIDQATYSRVLLNGDFVPDDEVGATFRMSASQWSVALAHEQASQAQNFHRWLADEHPEVISRGDRRVGNVNAALMAQARRASYWLLKRRMR